MKERRRAQAMIREDILQKFPDLFGTKKVNGREVNIEQTIAALTRELDPEIAAALTARRALLHSPAPVSEKYAWPKWDDTFEDPISGQPWTFRQIVQGLIDNFLGRESKWRWRLNDEVPIPKDAHPLTNPGLELTGPWHPLDMAFNALNSPAPMNMPDFEDASPPHFQPDGTPTNQPVGIFAAMQNAKEIFEGRWADRPYEVVKKGQKRAYKIKTSPAQWPTRFDLVRALLAFLHDLIGAVSPASFENLFGVLHGRKNPHRLIRRRAIGLEMGRGGVFEVRHIHGRGAIQRVEGHVQRMPRPGEFQAGIRQRASVLRDGRLVIEPPAPLAVPAENVINQPLDDLAKRPRLPRHGIFKRVVPLRPCIFRSHGRGGLEERPARG